MLRWFLSFDQFSFQIGQQKHDSLTSLFWNFDGPYAKVVQVLLKHGADATHCDKDGTSVLNAATAAGSRCNDELVLALLAVNGLLGLKFQGLMW